MKFLRRIYSITEMDKIRQRIKEELQHEAIEEYIERKQPGWLGHMFRNENTAQVKKVRRAKLQEKMKRERK